MIGQCFTSTKRAKENNAVYLQNNKCSYLDVLNQYEMTLQFTKMHGMESHILHGPRLVSPLMRQYSFSRVPHFFLPHFLFSSVIGTNFPTKIIIIIHPAFSIFLRKKNSSSISLICHTFPLYFENKAKPIGSIDLILSQPGYTKRLKVHLKIGKKLEGLTL